MVHTQTVKAPTDSAPGGAAVVATVVGLCPPVAMICIWRQAANLPQRAGATGKGGLEHDSGHPP
jgi:hypothetical protein